MLRQPFAFAARLVWTDMAHTSILLSVLPLSPTSSSPLTVLRSMRPTSRAGTPCLGTAARLSFSEEFACSRENFSRWVVSVRSSKDDQSYNPLGYIASDVSAGPAIGAHLRSKSMCHDT